MNGGRVVQPDSGASSENPRHRSTSIHSQVLDLAQYQPRGLSTVVIAIPVSAAPGAKVQELRLEYRMLRWHPHGYRSARLRVGLT